MIFFKTCTEHTSFDSQFVENNRSIKVPLLNDSDTSYCYMGKLAEVQKFLFMNLSTLPSKKCLQP